MQLEQREDQGIATCTTCPRLCRYACPVAETEARESTSPHSLVVLGGMVKKGHLLANVAREPVFHCSHCFACTEACLHQNDVPLWVSLTRQRLLQEHMAPKAVSELCGHFGVAGNAQGRTLEPEVEKLQTATQYSESNGTKLYVPGCETLTQTPNTAIDFLRAVQILGVPNLSLNPHSARCCGLPLFWAGDLEAFRAHALGYQRDVAAYESLVVHDPACAHTLSVRYREVGVVLEQRVEPMVVFLQQRLAKKGVSFRYSGRVVLGPVCSLQRGLKLQDEVMTLLTMILGQPPKALMTAPEPADCCGAGGLLPLTAPATARAMAENWLERFATSGGDTLVVPSPRCAAHLRTVDSAVDIVDLPSLMLRV